MAMLVELIKKRPDLSREEFQHYYETQHAPFNLGRFRRLFTGYSRSYVSGDRLNAGLGDIPVDVVTRIEFASDAGMEEMFTLSRSMPGHRAELIADEEGFMNRETTHIVLTKNDVRTPLDRDLTTTTASITVMIKRRPDLTHDEFREYYETEHVPLVCRNFRHLLTSYTRSYVFEDYVNNEPGDRAVDAVAYLEFPDAAAMDEMLTLVSSTPELAALISGDEAEFMDRDATHVMFSTARTGYVAAGQPIRP